MNDDFNEIMKARDLLVGSMVTNIIRTELGIELETLRPEVAQGIADRICRKVEEALGKENTQV